MLDDQLPLPPLRQELKLKASQPDANGRPRWKLYDPFLQRVYLLGHEDIELLSNWSLGSVGALKSAFSAKMNPINDEDIADLIAFLNDNFLVKSTRPERSQQLSELAKKTRSRWRDMLTPGKSKRLPIWDPNPLINEIMPTVRWIGASRLIMIWLAITLIGFYLVAQEWDQFLTTFSDFFSISGLFMYVLTLVLVKFAHEFGHAFAAAYQGCRVGKVNLTLFMGLPLLSTELNEAARLDSGKQRAWISAGGLLIETMIASLALIAWTILPEGALKGLMFIIATAIWITSLLINLNFFSRFDGYYLISDLLDIENLQPRALAFTRWEFERLIYGDLHSAPEAVSPKLGFLLFSYGCSVWAYQVLIFSSIALLFYVFASQLIGIGLFLFIFANYAVKPLKKFISAGWQQRQQVSRPRLWSLLIILFTLGLLCFIPLNQHTRVPVMLGWSTEHVIQAPENSRIIQMYESNLHRPIEAGELLYRFESPDLTAQLRQAQLRLKLTQGRLNRTGGSAQELSQRVILQEELSESRQALVGLKSRLAKLTWYAPEAGYLVDVPHTLAPGQWVRPDSNLGRVITGRSQDAVGYLPEAQINRVSIGQEAVFYPDEPSQDKMLVRLVDVESAAAESIQPDALSSSHGGPIATQDDENNIAIPVRAQHRIRFKVITPHYTRTPMLSRGTVVLPAKAESLANQIGQRIWQLWVREIRQ